MCICQNGIYTNVLVHKKAEGGFDSQLFTEA
ncbi:hypothetical protein SAMN04488505_1021160 [Chitinophaga rupis]|jgi:hypothetical protein|uniref:Uncharacterized protein n=1 Tax=Chitinophaga rupis TaxID=573321 RepID=A0A1H7T839_9BACT|nr:hypothetical protein SAMN04488505_1021160 [Chitinophaga rupis]